MKRSADRLSSRRQRERPVLFSYFGSFVGYCTAPWRRAGNPSAAFFLSDVPSA